MAEKYENIQKKFGLPNQKDLEKEFGIEIKKPIPKDIAEEVIKVLSENARMLESLIFVDSGSPASHLYEASMLREEDIDVFELYKSLMATYWQGKKLLMEGNDQKICDFIGKTMLKWKKAKADLLRIFELFEKKWPEVVLRDSSEPAYHG
ncbi:MAG: hypothetical protein QXM68_02505 [Candidatus Aenigmatarchaeota archaeon]|nr:hypothetical protein [Candidatus Aenigmarchaeota archaeon]